MDSPDTKLPLFQGSIDNFQYISQRTWTVGNCISCTVHNYSDLAGLVYHCLTRPVSHSKFTLKVLKNVNTHFFQLHCELTDERVFHVLYDEGKFSVVIPSVQTEYGYWVKVPRKIIYDPRNKYLHEGNLLVVEFHYTSDGSFVRQPFALSGRRMTRDEELFSQDMLKLYDRRETTGDFSINVQGEQFSVHKFVFDARTRWFKSNPKSYSWKQISIKGEPLMMDKVVRYMYSGKLEETDLGGMLQVLEIAVTLEMTGLMKTLVDAVIKILTKENALKVLKVARKLGMVDLASYAEECLPERETVSERQRRGSKNRKRR